jgi:hypothetical protein
MNLIGKSLAKKISKNEILNSSHFINTKMKIGYLLLED